MTDHDTDPRPSKRLRTNSETVDLASSPSIKESESIHPIVDILGQLAELAGPESSNPYRPLLSSLPASFHTTLLASKQYKLAFDVCLEIDRMFKEIAEEVKKTSSYETKRNAVDAMTEILESVCAARDTLGEEVKNSYQARGEWDERLVEVSAKFQQEELEALANGEWFEELCSLKDSGASYRILEGLEKAVEMLSGYVDHEEGATDEEENNI
ncbi:hypothetical protein QBC32DRAFT_366248 [Pseudoneurospora amorphoporcata]|uniref:Uncharacterized protein n=1 Tax=Pseudoneurospora amorphoporcata TaxID=241081 RepID=A0AAN6NL06_9PEZI|nr:hypothetical protein QBC32DRAFT_366248 [Pseudoneurospora amorphoporcata]